MPIGPDGQVRGVYSNIYTKTEELWGMGILKSDIDLFILPSIPYSAGRGMEQFRCQRPKVNNLKFR